MKFNFLKERAKNFYEVGEGLREKKKYNLSAFTLEQAVQLWVKYLLGKEIGDWPKTRYFSELIPQLAEAYENKEFLDFYKERELFFETLSDAYFTARYFPKEFSENSVNKLFEESKKFFSVVKKITGEDFYA